MSRVKRLVAALPYPIRFELEAQLRGWQVRTNRFTADEPEYALLPEFVHSGDWVLDIGANVGHYTFQLSRLVGRSGRVVALEPTTHAFAQLAGTVARSGLHNVTLINAAASDTNRPRSMSVPSGRNGLPSFYEARLEDGEADAGGQRVIALRVDDIPLSHDISFVKIDVEGHEIPALQGMLGLIERDRPVLVIEDSSPEIQDVLAPLGYEHEKLSGSPNCLFRPRPDGTASPSA